MKRRTLKRDPKQVKKSFKKAFKSGNRKKPNKKRKTMKSTDCFYLRDDKDQCLSLTFRPFPKSSSSPFSKICKVHHRECSLKNSSGFAGSGKKSFVNSKESGDDSVERKRLLSGVKTLRGQTLKANNITVCQSTGGTQLMMMMIKTIFI